MIAPGMCFILKVKFFATSFSEFRDEITFISEENVFKVNYKQWELSASDDDFICRYQLLPRKKHLKLIFPMSLIARAVG